MKKELLTDKIIKKELNKRCHQKALELMHKSIMLVLAVVVSVFLIKNGFPIGLKGVLLALAIIPLLGVVIYDAVNLTKLLKGKSKYTVIKETLIRTEKKHYISNRAFNTRFFHFAGFAKHPITDDAYKWSKMHNMTSVYFFEHAAAGDEFYLVVVNKKIQLVYHCKYFDYLK